MEPRLAHDRIAQPENLEGEINEPRRSRFGIVFKGGEAKRRVFLEIGLARIDQPIEMRPRQRELADRGGQRLDDDMMTDGAALVGDGDVLAPPLEADLSEHRLSDALAHPCNLVIEGVKRE